MERSEARAMVGEILRHCEEDLKIYITKEHLKEELENKISQLRHNYIIGKLPIRGFELTMMLEELEGYERGATTGEAEGKEQGGKTQGQRGEVDSSTDGPGSVGGGPEPTQSKPRRSKVKS